MISFTRNMASGEIKLYVDAILQASATGGTSSLTANASWYLGSLPLSHRYEGNIDELNAWTTVLNEEKLAYIYERQRPDSAGYSVSRVMDSFQANTNWTSMSWTTTRPFGKALPDYNAGPQNESASNYNEIVHTTTHTNLVGLYHFDEPADASAPGGTYFKDSSVSANHGSFAVSSGSTNTIQFGKSGRFNKGIYFPGTGAVNLGASATTDFGSDAFSISFWMKTHSKVRRLIASKLTYQNTGIDAFIGSTGAIVFGIGCPNGSLESVCPYIQTTDADYADGKWHHIVLMNDKSYNVMKIFVDGRVKAVAKHASWGGCLVMQNASQEANFSACSINGDRSGTSLYVGSFESFLTPYIGYIDELAIWKSRLDNGRVYELFRRGANRLNFQVRTCPDTTCTGVTWQGMNGTADSFFSEINNNSNPQALNGIVLPGAPSVTFANHASVILPPNRYFQYQYIMESDASITVDTCGYSGGGACSPELRTVSVAPNTGYPTNAPGISYNVAIPYYTLSGSFTESVTCPAGVKYLLSVDNATWKWWDGSAWATSNGTAAQSNSLGTLNSNVATFATSVGRTSLYVKALLQSNGTLNCTIDAFGVTGNNVF